MRRYLSFVLLLLLMTVSFLFAEDREPNPTPKPASLGMLDVITYSDGKIVKGKLFLRGDTSLKMYDLQRETYVTVPFSDFARIDVRIEKESMEKVWYFKDEGSPVKTYTGEEYPLHEYITKVTLRNGVEFETHLATVLFIKIDDAEGRVFLLTKQKGNTIQNLSDLVYVKTIEFFDRRLVPDGGSLEVKPVLKGEKLLRAVALSWSTDQSFTSAPKGGSFNWSDLPPDFYDIFVVTDKNIHYYLSPIDPSKKKAGGGDDLEDIDEKPLDGTKKLIGAGLTEDEKQSLIKYIADADEFFEVKEALDFGGNPKQVRVIVRQRRVEETSYGTKARKQTLWRYDLWFLHRIQTEWKIDSRAFLWRGYLPEGDASGVPVLKHEESLGGLDLTEKVKVHKMAFPAEGGG